MESLNIVDGIVIIIVLISAILAYARGVTREVMAIMGKISNQMSTSDTPSPRWYTILMSSLMILGVLLIVLNYLTLLPGSVSRWYLWSGLGLIGAGFLMTTNYN